MNKKMAEAFLKNICKATSIDKLSKSTPKNKTSDSQCNPLSLLDPNCDFKCNLHWKINIDDSLKKYTKQCWLLCRHIAISKLKTSIGDKNYYRYDQLFPGNCQRIKPSIIADISDSEIELLSLFPLSGFFLEVKTDEESCSSNNQILDYSFFDKTYDDPYINILSEIVLLATRNNSIYAGSFGITSNDLQILSKLTLSEIIKAINNHSISLKCNLTEEQIDLLLFLTRFKKLYQLQPSDLLTHKFYRRNIEMLRKEVLKELCTIVARLADNLKSAITSPSVCIAELPLYVTHEMYPMELAQLGFSINQIARFTNVSVKQVNRRVLDNENYIYSNVGVLPKDLRRKNQMTRLEQDCHRTLFLNIMLLTELLYTRWVNTDFVHQRKFILSCEIYFQILNCVGTWLGSLSPRHLGLLEQRISTSLVDDFLTDCVSHVHNFQFYCNYTEAKGKCPFCRKHFLLERENKEHHRFFKEFMDKYNI